MPRVSSGLPVVIVIRPTVEGAKLQTITATKALAYRGMTLLRAKRAIEAAVGGEAVIEVPMVEHLPTLARELLHAGFEASQIGASTVDIKALRDRLHMSQEEFARRYGLEVGALRNWEQKRRALDGTALLYLRAIEKDPEGTARAQENEILEKEGA